MNLDDFYQQMPNLTTQRLLLRKLRMEDAQDYFTFAGDPRVTRYLRWGPHASLQETQSYLQSVLEGYRQGTDGPWGIELVEEGRLVGSIHLMDLDPSDLKADVGVVVNAQYWRRGIGSEALQRVLAFSLTELHLQRIQVFAITGNIAACQMMEKCGMAHEGTLHRYARQKGQRWDFELYAIRAEDFHQDRIL